MRIGPGTLYGALTNLVKQKLIERVGEQESEGERRKVYGLTGLGKSAIFLESERIVALAEIGKLAMEKLKDVRSEK